MGLGDWACLQIETQEVDLSWNSLSQGLPRWSCRQSMVYLMLLSPAFQEQYIGRMCAYLNFPDISTASLHDVEPWPVLLQGILHWSSSSWCLQLDWSKAVKKRSSELPCLKTTIFCSPTSELFQGNRLHSSSLEKHFSLGAKFTMNALKDQLKL